MAEAINRDAIQTGDEVTWQSKHENRSMVAYTLQNGCAVFTGTGGIITVPWHQVTAHHPKEEQERKQ